MRNTIKKIQQLKNKRPISCLTAYSSSISKNDFRCFIFFYSYYRDLIDDISELLLKE